MRSVALITLKKYFNYKYKLHILKVIQLLFPITFGNHAKIENTFSESN